MEGPRFVLAIDHRLVMVKACQERRVDLSRLAEFKALVVEAVASARAQRPAAAPSMMALVDDQHGRKALEVARRAEVGVGMPVEEGGVVPLAFSRPDWEAAIVGRRPAFIKVRFNGGPFQDPSQRAAQEKGVLEISRACERHGVPFVPEPLLDPHPQEMTDLERAQTMIEWTGSLRALGVQVRFWKLEGFADPKAAEALAASLPRGEDVLLLGGTGTREHLAACFRAIRKNPKFQGFSVGRNIFWDAYVDFLGGADPAAAQERVRARYLETVDLWVSSQA